jgi:hypothetical protein
MRCVSSVTAASGVRPGEEEDESKKKRRREEEKEKEKKKKKKRLDRRGVGVGAIRMWLHLERGISAICLFIHSSLLPLRRVEWEEGGRGYIITTSHHIHHITSKHTTA